MKTPEWWAEYKCPKCGYESYVTNVCRSCSVSMCATGYEHKGNKRRPMTKESDTYNQAVFASNAYRRGYELGYENYDVPVPNWVWFGGQTG